MAATMLSAASPAPPGQRAARSERGGTLPLPQLGPPIPAELWSSLQATMCLSAIARAETAHAIPSGLLRSIALVESGKPITSVRDVRPWPWTIDADGAGLFLDSKAAAIAWVAQAHKRGARYIDVGCLQVDLRLHPDAFADLDTAFDPEANADYAARYLVSLRREAGGDWNVAVGLYHSHTPDLAADYRDRVAGVGRGILTGIGGPEPLFRRALRQGTLRLALSGGGGITVRIRQPGSAQHLSRCALAETLAPLLNAPPRMSGCKPFKPAVTHDIEDAE